MRTSQAMRQKVCGEGLGRREDLGREDLGLQSPAVKVLDGEDLRRQSTTMKFLALPRA